MGFLTGLGSEGVWYCEAGIFVVFFSDYKGALLDLCGYGVIVTYPFLKLPGNEGGEKPTWVVSVLS